MTEAVPSFVCPTQASINAGCFEPYVNGSVSGFMPQKNARLASLYVDRAASWVANTSCGRADCSYGLFGFASTLRLTPNQATVALHVFVDRSIIEVFAAEGRATITASNIAPLFQNGAKHRDLRVLESAWECWVQGTSRIQMKYSLTLFYL